MASAGSQGVPVEGSLAALARETVVQWRKGIEKQVFRNIDFSCWLCLRRVMSRRRCLATCFQRAGTDRVPGQAGTCSEQDVQAALARCEEHAAAWSQLKTAMLVNFSQAPAGSVHQRGLKRVYDALEMQEPRLSRCVTPNISMVSACQ